MPKNSQTAISDQQQQLYALIMYDIEQDLLLGNIESLDLKYKGETKKERTKRMKRYRRAIQTFYQRLMIIMNVWEKDLKAFLKEARINVEETITAMEKQNLQSIDFKHDQ
jgi:hypothetical protein